MSYSTATLDAARAKLIAWLRLRRGEWLSTSDHQLALRAGLTDADAGMHLLKLLAADTMVEIEQHGVQRFFRFVGTAPDREAATRILVDVAADLIAQRRAALSPPPAVPPIAQHKQETPVPITHLPRSGTRTISFRLSPSEHDRLYELAQAEDVSVSSLLRRLVVKQVYAS